MITIEELNTIEFFADGQYENQYGMVNATAIDSEVARKPCNECGTMREYRQVLHRNTYRAFAVCASCKNAIEF